MSRYLILILLFCSFLSFAQKINRTPYLQKPTPNSITIRWRTDQSVKGKINYHKDGSDAILSETEVASVFNHEVELKGLEPDTKYFYQIATDEKILESSEKLYFKTLPAADLKRPLRIWAMGDFGDFTRKAYVDNQNGVYESFKKFNAGKDVDLWMWLGDNAYCCGTDNQYQLGVFEYFSSDFFAKTPIVSVPGNHEYYYAAGSEVTRDIPYFDLISVHTKGEGGGVPSGNKAYYSFNIGNIHFISLDTYGLDNGKKLSDRESPQYKWFISDLEENLKQNNMWTVVFLHHPPYTKRSHDSDTEPDLVEFRRTLVPVFDQYKVDLVLSGHSHTYERSYLINNHTGFSETFDASQHIVQNTKALYTADSPPIINKNAGTLYAVAGSAGRLDWNGKNEPHPISAYANKDLGGSLLLTIDNNRLEGKWMCADATIKDSFTMFKNVNVTQTLEISYGKEIELSASWPGNYRWSTGDAAQRTLKKRFFENTEITVTDSLGHLADKFFIKVGPRPSVKSVISSGSLICSGKPFSGQITVENERVSDWSYQLLLSDKNGNFTNSTNLGKINSSNFSIKLPENSEQGSQYKLKAIVPENPYFESIESGGFVISNPAKAQILQEGSIPYTSEIQLTIKVQGSLPDTLKISHIPEMVLLNPETTIKVNPKGGEKYQIEYVKNVCGVGNVLGEGLAVEQPLGLEKELKMVKVYPNPSHGKFEIESPATKDNPAELEVISTLGKVIRTKTLFSKNEKIDIENQADGLYIFKVSQKGKSTSVKVQKN